ncbi:hypothetical protein S40285_06468 [Stachybotrys chlorohalonatus IBT 40285]|uniref:CENP-V/GFA domain-containing protein n=1 Tax=Stachybotrys chlorohalonatus (strain IBT 40285) TaxID=1283841 RepID=A0A084QB73_STAC4|nr:hypothetical protein S40285_06468 [Stachybotrys chlorohalonata IBT 40285]
MSTTDMGKPSGLYEAGCHCGIISFSFKLSPPLPEYKVLECNCSICRRAGYLLVYPSYDDVTWHNDSKAKCAVYQFNSKTKDQLFCPTCGASIGIDFKNADPQRYGISARTINNVDLDKLQYEKLDGINKVGPAEDLSGRMQATPQDQ